MLVQRGRDLAKAGSKLSLPTALGQYDLLTQHETLRRRRRTPSDPTREMSAIADRPLEKRYVWRIASAMKWGFADFDDLGVTADRETLSPEDAERVAELLQHRPIQFCIFLKALYGEEQMERVMLQAIAIAKSAE